ncbi:MAG: LysR family transcriptional regulator [Streptosporangiales bacterium]|nr:LysR family transcriptional regulator [Streptosporangiales bacterium]
MVLPAGQLELADLDLLLSVQRLGSLGKAAREHGVSQPAASSRIQALERRLGLRLLERSPSGSRLTPAGAMVATWGRRVVDAAAELLSGCAALRDAADRWLRIAANSTTADYLMPSWLAELRSRQTGLTVELRMGNSHEVVQQVRAGTVDVGFVDDPCPHAGLVEQVIAEDELGVFVAPTHPWAGYRRPVTPDELAGEITIVRERGSGTRETVDRVLGELCDGEPHLELSSTTAIKEAVAAGGGAAVISHVAVRHELRNHELVAVPVVDVDLTIRLRAVWRRNVELPDAALALVKLAMDEMSASCPVGMSRIGCRSDQPRNGAGRDFRHLRPAAPAS